jgi:hypothetical protein
MLFAEYNDMVKAVASDRTDEPLRVSVLPWRAGWGRLISYAHGGEAPDEGFAVRAIAIANQASAPFLPAAGFG